MHSSHDAASTWQRNAATTNRAGTLSFPPTQRTGLLRSTARAAARSATGTPARSNDQVANLTRATTHLLEVLSAQPLQHAAAM